MGRIDTSIRESMSRQQACLDLFGSIRSVLTTSHVIAEVQGLQKLSGDDFRNFWLNSMKLLAAKGLDERLLCLIEDTFHRDDVRNSVAQIGPTEAGLIELARREGCVLLTDDERTLAPPAYQLGVHCEIFKALLP